MLVFFIIALIGTLFLVITAVLGEVFDFLGDMDADGDVHPFSGKTIAIALTTFGAAGMIASYYELDMGFRVLISLFAALFLGALAWWMLSALQSQAGSTDVSVGSLQGRLGEVTVNIPAGSVGEVLVTAVSGTRQMIARAVDGGAIPAGTTVRIVEARGTMLLVQPVQRTAQVASAAERMEG